ncbi:MAG: hypothetical protein CMF22_10335 [Idiomarinaceae bacterium]|nr:hypothetical protein [Idiomarinaceae bacterium]MBG23838.1 hypothetical protein [Idiomarinaceae bacterium]
MFHKRITNFNQLNYGDTVYYNGEIWRVGTLYESGDVVLIDDETDGPCDYIEVHVTELDHWVSYSFDD